ncbi:hypothetical protein LTR84_000218 [Exophiala bonariae]|uniref:GIY-YIG domain-containing protein n=1 Tax=Exophiala bonariae TaxID=1690606 RepID=A0AAV9NSK3_9EURO|nr:hypothetical protein LTR84_000218 [Exophiala bonariae]
MLGKYDNVANIAKKIADLQTAVDLRKLRRIYGIDKRKREKGFHNFYVGQTQVNFNARWQGHNSGYKYAAKSANGVPHPRQLIQAVHKNAVGRFSAEQRTFIMLALSPTENPGFHEFA